MREREHRVRRREPADLDGCVRALAEVHTADGYPMVWPDRPADWLAEADQLACWVAIAPDGAVVGHAALAPGVDSSAAHVWAERTGRAPDRTVALSRLYVAPAARGHGLGAELLAVAADYARSAGLWPVLDVVTMNGAAVELYERQGWTRMLTVDQQWPDGRVVAVHCYALGEGGGTAHSGA
ncbi:GNAT superfamily N-acetyltransferase [Kitasatospora sp. GP30]|uniref:GNAT family N-acetyltransferase n=1 Tax=Kitasatospora sp. GP30 TaxID=3035084 RepID=UPI000C7125D3|nr:GNAT family N-acetyltransferase [Kitasatospora sp. GP30]MDH6143004.1 GNAT superfamily N-acetyltransferase [Kitasatospora sp. GP30]